MREKEGEVAEKNLGKVKSQANGWGQTKGGGWCPVLTAVQSFRENEKQTFRGGKYVTCTCIYYSPSKV